MFWSSVLLFLCSSAVSLVFAIPIDNNAIGLPEVQCIGDSVLIDYNTEKPWDGVFFVKNHRSDTACVVRGNGTHKVASLRLRFDQCGVSRRRSLEPRGIFVSATVVLSFHKKVITKVDRAAAVHCFYMEADKSVSQEAEVSMLTTAFATLTVPMPVCRYEILENTENGKPVRFAIIGMQVFHKWTCDTDTADTFCMTVVNCIVSDGANDTIQLLDDQGCALDKHILSNIEYPTDLMAGKEAHVFKYADRANLYFNCQIAIIIKEPNQACKRPVCAEPTRRRRLVTEQTRRYQATDMVTDVAPPSILVADIGMNENDVESGLRFAAAANGGGQAVASTQNDYNGVCLNVGSFNLMLITVFFFLSIAGAALIYTCT